MKKIVLTLVAAMIFSWQGTSFADSSVDALIQKLQDKGILTDQEASQLKDEVSNKEQTNEQATFKSLLPDWLNTIKFTGDMRLRDQYQRISVAGSSTTTGTPSAKAGYNRGRVRARLNMEDQLNDKLKVIFGIATTGENGAGVGNPRSNNLTFGGNNNPTEDSFNKPQVVVNKAYAIYSPASWATIMGGKMDNPIWEPASLLWDPNITPEGGTVQLQKKLNDLITPFSTDSMFVIADASPHVGSTTAFKTDPYIFITQDGIKGNLTEKAYYKAAVSYYAVNNPDRVTFGNRPSATVATNSATSATNNTNSTDPFGSQYIYGYYLIGGSVDMGINDPFGDTLPSPIYIPQIGVFGQYFENKGAPHNNDSWMMGGYMGSSQLNGWGTWKAQSYYKVLERDSWLDIFPDQDDYNGATDTAGWRSELDIGLAKNVWFTLSWYHMNVYKDFPILSQGSTAYSASAPENLYQMDFNFKF